MRLQPASSGTALLTLLCLLAPAAVAADRKPVAPKPPVKPHAHLSIHVPGFVGAPGTNISFDDQGVLDLKQVKEVATIKLPAGDVAALEAAMDQFVHHPPPFYYGNPDVMDGTHIFVTVATTDLTRVCWVANSEIPEELQTFLSAVREIGLKPSADDKDVRVLRTCVADAGWRSVDEIAESKKSRAQLTPEQRAALENGLLSIPNGPRRQLTIDVAHVPDKRWDSQHREQAIEILRALPLVEAPPPATKPASTRH